MQATDRETLLHRYLSPDNTGPKLGLTNPLFIEEAYTANTEASAWSQEILTIIKMMTPN